MIKQEVQQRILQNGKLLDLDKFSWDEKTKTFFTIEDNLVLDFKGVDSVKFITGSYCNFNTSSDCNFITGNYCIFKTGSDCIFKTGSNCSFDTGYNCNFNTGSDCVVVRRDIYEIIELNGKGKVKLNCFGIKGYTEIKDEVVEEIVEETITLNGKTYKLVK